jgi:hypothetical protein
VIIFIAWAGDNFAAPMEDEEDKILSAAENVFAQMKNKNYPAIWDGLSAKTKEIIISDVYKASKKMKIEIAKEELAKDFSSSGLNAKAYWDGYLKVFDPVVVLEQCRWGMGKVKEKTAEIYVLKKNAERPALLKMYKEDGVWKLGLEESFGARKLNPF